MQLLIYVALLMLGGLFLAVGKIRDDRTQHEPGQEESWISQNLTTILFVLGAILLVVGVGFEIAIGIRDELAR